LKITHTKSGPQAYAETGGKENPEVSMLKKANLHRQKSVPQAAGPCLACIALGIIFSIFPLRMLASSRSVAWLVPTAGGVVLLRLGFDLFYKLLAVAEGKHCATKQKSRRKM
jgi:hypothetical protein